MKSIFFFLRFKKDSQQFQIPKHRFKERQNAPFLVLAFKIFSAAQKY